jgi:hypothetical protein
MTMFSVSLLGIWVIIIQGDEPLLHFWQQTVHSTVISPFTQILFMCFWNHTIAILTPFFNLCRTFSDLLGLKF